MLNKVSLKRNTAEIKVRHDENAVTGRLPRSQARNLRRSSGSVSVNLVFVVDMIEHSYFEK